MVTKRTHSLSPKHAVIALAALAVAAVLAFVLLASSEGDGEPRADSPEAFLQRVEAALRDQGEVAHVTGNTTVNDGQSTELLWSSEAWFDSGNGAVRSSLKKAPGNTLDLPDELVQLRVGNDVYSATPGSDDPTSRLTRNEGPACATGEPASQVTGLLCGFASMGGDARPPRVEGLTDFQGRSVRSLAVLLPDGGSVMRLFVDAETYLPVGQRRTDLSGGGQYILETTYQVDALARSTLAPDFFEARGMGYVSPEEEWLRILDDPALGIPVYWPGRAITGSGDFDAVLTHVDDRRAPPGIETDTPGHVLTLSYQGNGGLLRLDYWPEGEWEEFQQRLGEGFVFAACSEESTSTVPAGDLTILRGHEPEAGMEALPTPFVATPGAPVPAPPAPSFDPFPNGCPGSDYDHFMAVMRVQGMVVTINATYGFCCQDGRAFGVYDTEAGLIAIAEKLRLRQPGE